MTKSEYFEFAENFFGECIEISRKKNADYTGDVSNPFANFEAVEMLHVGTAQGFLTRMQDKMMRIASFVKNGNLQVKDESVQDTLRDLANYSCLMSGWIESQKKLQTSPNACENPTLLQLLQMNFTDRTHNGMLSFDREILEKIITDGNLHETCGIRQLNDVLVNILKDDQAL